MDDFVYNKLTEWGLSEWIERFKDQDIDQKIFECLEDQDIDKLIPKVGPRVKLRMGLKLLKEQKSTYQEAEDVSNAGPSTSDSSHEGRRKYDPQGELCRNQPPTKKRRISSGSLLEKGIHSEVKELMTCVRNKLHSDEKTKFKTFLENKIRDLDMDKRELVGVFGKSGAGKSSLINAIIEELDLLPSGDVKACTSVMIKVEANTSNNNYEAEIEFITSEDWKDDIWSLFNILENDQENDEDEFYRDISDKLSAVYGEEWKTRTPENLMDNKYFKEIPEFLNNTIKNLAFDSAKELTAKLVQYTRSESKKGAVNQWYWPLVKCVTVKVPNNPLLQYVTLVDLPGCGDYNRSRDKMWKGLLGSCSTVWIVTDINRAASEKEAWEILENACSLMGNGGQCQQIHFICTKTDYSDKWDDLPADLRRVCILNRNKEAKEEVLKEFNKRDKIKKHFSNESFKVFTVSSKEFLKGKRSKPTILPDETEIPELQQLLENLNDHHSETLNYVSGAYGILSLMQGAQCRDTAVVKTEACSQLQGMLRCKLPVIKQSLKDTYRAFVQCLTKGVEKSEGSCEATLRSFLNPRQKGGFCGTLKCVVLHRGVHKPKKKRPINLNMRLSSVLTSSIDEEFRKTFPNEGTRSPFNGVISEFSLDTEKLIEKYKVVELQLIFLKTEEEKLKTKVDKIIREGKKTVYNSLTETIEKAMEDGYKQAAQFRGRGTLNSMKQTLEKHLRDSKDNMFKMAKYVMLQKLKELMETVWETLGETMDESITLSLNTDDQFIPDFSEELDRVKKYHCRERLS